MAELHRVEINERAPQEIDPESEEAVDAVSEEQTQETQEDRPDWLPEKFKSPEDMANAYSELEKKMGAGANDEQEQEEAQQEEEQSTDEQDDTQEEGNDLSKLLNEANDVFQENNNELPEESYEKLVEAGIPKNLIDQYIAGGLALQQQKETNAQQEESNIKAAAEGNWDQMAEWAANNLSPEEVETFDEIVQNGTVEQAKLATKGLYAQFKAENGVAPKLVQGAVSGSSTMPFKSNQELARAMSDPRYKSGDKSYHEEIDRRIEASQNYL
jgi:hypothetical protein